MFSVSTNVLLGLFFMINEKQKKILKTKIYFQKHQFIGNCLSVTFLCYFFAFLYTPFYSIKTYILLNTSTYENKLNTKSIIKKIFREDGVKGFYRGFLPMVILGLNGSLTVLLNDIMRNIANTEDIS